MGTRLYPNTNPDKYTSAELLNIILWYTTIKQHFANTFTHLFAPAPTPADCWRALTELDAKAHDAQELQRFRKSDEQRK